MTSVSLIIAAAYTPLLHLAPVQVKALNPNTKPSTILHLAPVEIRAVEHPEVLAASPTRHPRGKVGCGGGAGGVWRGGQRGRIQGGGGEKNKRGKRSGRKKSKKEHQ